MEDELVLQSEEILKTTQQVQDETPYDPNAAVRFPEGYTPTGKGVDNTKIEEVSVGRVGEVEATADVSTPLGLNVRQDASYSSEFAIDQNSQTETIENGIPFSSPTNFNNRFSYLGDAGNIRIGSNINLDLPDLGVNDKEVKPEDPEDKLVDPPIDPPEPPVEPPEPPVEPPVDPPEPPVEPPVDPPEPPVEPPVDPPEPPVEPPVDPPEPPVDPPEPEEPTGSNPGNDKEVGNSPWDGETGASDNPGKGNNQDGQDPEPNQPPGDSKNDGGKNNNEKDPPGNGGGGGKPENHQDNGWGNGDDDPPGNSGPNNNAENDATPSEHYDDFIGRFIEENPVDDFDVSYNWEQDNADYLDYAPMFNPEFDYVPELPNFDDFSATDFYE